MKSSPDAVRTDDDEVRGANARTEQLHIDRLSRFEVLALSRNRDKAVRAPEGRDRAGTFPQRDGDV